MNTALRVCVVDDELGPADAGSRFSTQFALANVTYSFVDGLSARGAVLPAGEIAGRVLDTRSDAVLLDIRFKDADDHGLKVLSELRARGYTGPLIMLTGLPKRPVISECVRRGATDFLVKPLNPRILRQTLDRYVRLPPSLWLVGLAERFLSCVDQVAASATGGTTSVLLSGAPGTGKELFARFLHRHGARREKPFQVVHVPALPRELLEAELFGYSAGAFTGAVREEPGRLVRTAGGVLFLDEVSDLSPAAQAILLRALETGEVSRLGDGRVTRIDVQVVAATNADLATRVRQNRFRLDLYTRIAGTVVHLPSLHERPDDVPLLARHLFRRAAAERSLATVTQLPDAPVEALRLREWPGNVRDLWNFVQRVLDRAEGRAPTPDDFEEAGASLPLGSPAAPAAPAARRAADDGVPEVSEGDVRNAQRFLEDLAQRELALLDKAIELTRDPVSAAPRRAKAAALLKGKARCSTNEFDRWAVLVLKRLRPEARARAVTRYGWLRHALSDETRE